MLASLTSQLHSDACTIIQYPSCIVIRPCLIASGTSGLDESSHEAILPVHFWLNRSVSALSLVSCVGVKPSLLVRHQQLPISIRQPAMITQAAASSIKAPADGDFYKYGLKPVLGEGIMDATLKRLGTVEIKDMDKSNFVKPKSVMYELDGESSSHAASTMTSEGCHTLTTRAALTAYMLTQILLCAVNSYVVPRMKFGLPSILRCMHPTHHLSLSACSLSFILLCDIASSRLW